MKRRKTWTTVAGKDARCTLEGHPTGAKGRADCRILAGTALRDRRKKSKRAP